MKSSRTPPTLISNQVEPVAQQLPSAREFVNKRSHWGLWFHMHEHISLSMRKRAMVHLRANWRMLGAPYLLAISSLIAIAPSLLFGLLLWIFDPLNPRRLQSNPIEPSAFLGLAGGAILLWLAVQHFFFVYTMNRYYAPFVRREMTRLGIPMCQECGHRLAGMQTPRCPECASELRPNIL